jgi:hypothetical protein
MTVNPNLPVSVSIAPSANPVCAGTSVTFTATPVNGGTPTYQWYKNTVFVGATSTYSYVPLTGDQVYVIMTSSLTCKSGSPATSNTVTMTVNPNLPVSVSIGPSANPVCAGTSVTFTATPVNGGTPTYQWFKNTISVGSGSTYTYLPVDGDQVYVIMTSSLSCISGSSATSNTVIMMVDPVLPVSVSIAPSANPVCTGTSVTFTATPTNGGTTLSYQWKVNGINVGTNSDTYSYIPVNNDAVTCILTSSTSCVNENQATSNTVTMIVNPNLPVSVSIAPFANPVCAGIVVTFTATPTNGGTTPAYQWKVNGINMGINSATYSYTPVNNDAVTCVLTSSASCVTGNPATSNTVTMIVNVLPVPTITGSSTLCSGISGIYTTQTGKTNYTWTVSSGANIVAGGTTKSSSITVKWTATGPQWVRVNYTNSSGCRATTYTQFNITINPLPVPSITGLKTVCQGATGIVYTTQTGMTGYTWTISTGGIITAGTGTKSITVSWPGSGSQWVKVNYSNTFGCTAATPVQYNVTVNRATVPSINGTNKVCAGTPGIVYTTQSGMTNYIWTVSPGGTILSGSGTRLVNVLWNTPGANSISVTYTPSSGCPVLTPTVKAVTVYALPTPTITGQTSSCVGAYEYYTTETGMNNYTWTIGGSGGIIYSGSTSYKIYIQWVSAGAKTISVNYTTTGGCRAPTPTVLNINVINCTDSMITGSDAGLSPASFTVYPNPNNGTFNAVIQCECREECSIDVFNMMGVKVFELTFLNTESKMVVPIDLQGLPQGIYTVIFRNSNHWMFRKVVINK